MTGAEQLAVVAAGLGAGVLTSAVGVASLLSFPVLVAVGLPPVVANASNTIGMTPAGLSGSFGYRAELREHPVITTTVFEAVVPWLILGTCLLVGAQPRLSRWLRSSAEAVPPGERTRLSPVTTVFS